MSNPAWFNAHCHLELSFLKGRISPGIPFVDWLRELIRIRREVPLEEQIAAAEAAVADVTASGTTILFDILRVDLADPILRRAALQSLLFREAIQMDHKLAGPAIAETVLRQEEHGPLPPHCHHGLSPHAVYTTTGPLLRAAAERAAMTGEWLCIHAAETREEEEFSLHGTGPLRDFLAPFLPGDWKAPGVRPIEWLDRHGCLGPRTLLVHCNEINDDEIRVIRERGCAVVVCPGTHVFFDRGAFPLSRLLEAGVPTFLGTDSLASNESLDMAREVELALELSPGISRCDVQRLAEPSAAAHFLSPRCGA